MNGFNVMLSEISGDAAHENTDKNRYAHRHKTDGQRNPCPLKHSRKDIPSQIIRSHQVDIQNRNLVRPQGFKIRFGQRRAELFLETNHGRIEQWFCPRGQNKARDSAKKKQHKNEKPQSCQPVLFQHATECLQPGPLWRQWGFDIIGCVDVFFCVIHYRRILGSTTR
jgi:hypothetical protein